MADLAAQGHALCLPVVQGRGKPLLFRAWRRGDALVRGSLGIPAPGPEAAPLVPGLLLVPLLAFDREGFRLGHGAGYYDMTLAGLRAAGPVLAVGIAYAGQEVARVPREVHDQSLDWVITESEAIRIGAKA
jgi:5-formyltetrahydrofolate cyclo-ligase